MSIWAYFSIACALIAAVGVWAGIAAEADRKKSN